MSKSVKVVVKLSEDDLKLLSDKLELFRSFNELRMTLSDALEKLQGGVWDFIYEKYPEAVMYKDRKLNFNMDTGEVMYDEEENMS